MYLLYIVVPCLTGAALLITGQHTFGKITGERIPGGQSPVLTTLQYISGCQLQVTCSCFLDKICIHQADMERKLRGISSLGTFMRMSEKITALWSEDYFERLWCVFEMAVFAGAREDKKEPMPEDVEFLPLWKAPFLYSLLFINVTAFAIQAWLQGTAWYVDLLAYEPLISGRGFLRKSILGPPNAGLGLFWMVVNVAPAVFTSVALRYKFLEHSKLYGWVGEFSLEKTKVAEPSDREIVYAEIEKMYGSISQFEAFVRGEKFFGVLQKTVGNIYSVPYRWGLIVFLPYVWYASVDALSSGEAMATVDYGYESWAAFAFGDFAFYLGMWFMLPLCLKVMGWTVFFTGRLANWSRESGAPFQAPKSVSKLFQDVYTNPLFYFISLCGTVLDVGVYLGMVFLVVICNMHLSVEIMAIFGFA